MSKRPNHLIGSTQVWVLRGSIAQASCARIREPMAGSGLRNCPCCVRKIAATSYNPFRGPRQLDRILCGSQDEARAAALQLADGLRPVMIYAISDRVHPSQARLEPVDAPVCDSRGVDVVVSG